jgi:hypothetical protein
LAAALVIEETGEDKFKMNKFSLAIGQDEKVLNMLQAG